MNSLNCHLPFRSSFLAGPSLALSSTGLTFGPWKTFMNALTHKTGEQGSPNTDVSTLRSPLEHPAGPVVMEERPLDILGRYQTLVHCSFQTSEDTCQAFQVIPLTSSLQNRGEGSRVAFCLSALGNGWVSQSSVALPNIYTNPLWLSTALILLYPRCDFLSKSAPYYDKSLCNLISVLWWSLCGNSQFSILLLVFQVTVQWGEEARHGGVTFKFDFGSHH